MTATFAIVGLPAGGAAAAQDRLADRIIDLNCYCRIPRPAVASVVGEIDRLTGIPVGFEALPELFPDRSPRLDPDYVTYLSWSVRYMWPPCSMLNRLARPPATPCTASNRDVWLDVDVRLWKGRGRIGFLFNRVPNQVVRPGRATWCRRSTRAMATSSGNTAPRWTSGVGPPRRCVASLSTRTSSF